MIFINHHLKAIYIRTPRSGGKYVSYILTTFYGFKEIEYIRDDVSDFFYNDDDLTSSVEFYRTEVYSIKKKGLLRYFLDESNDFSHLKISKEQWDSYYKFSFVVDPYYKLVSSYLLCDSHIFQDETSKHSYSSLNLFLDNKFMISNLAFFASFIPQFDQLLDYDNNIKMQYIGNIENLDKDLIVILNHIGMKELKHLEVERLNTSFHYKFEKRITDFYLFFDKEILKKTSNYFKDDFDCFKMKKFTNVKKMKDTYENNLDSASSSETQSSSENEKEDNVTLVLNAKMAIINEHENNINFKKLESDIDSFINYLEKIYDVIPNNFIFHQFKDMLKTNLNHIIMKNNEKKISLLLKNTSESIKKTTKEFYKEKSRHVCKKCKFVCYNETAKSAHNYFCKTSNPILENPVLENVFVSHNKNDK
jgi:hypothetical protein